MIGFTAYIYKFVLSKFLWYHIFVLKRLYLFTSTNIVCLKCNKGTTAKLQICDRCGGKNEREKQRYIVVIKSRRQEIARLKKENTLI